MLAMDLERCGFPVVRYEIRWTPERARSKGYVTHGSDRTIWSFRANEREIARSWLNAISAATEEAEKGIAGKGVMKVLTLREDRTIGWEDDRKWDEAMYFAQILPKQGGAKL